MKKSVIKQVREYYELPDTVSDANIAHTLEGSFGHAIINLNNAWRELCRAIKRAVRP